MVCKKRMQVQSESPCSVLVLFADGYPVVGTDDMFVAPDIPMLPEGVEQGRSGFFISNDFSAEDVARTLDSLGCNDQRALRENARRRVLRSFEMRKCRGGFVEELVKL